MLITVSGPPGSGKSTNAAALATEFGLDHVSGGEVFREMAADRGLTTVELNETAEDEAEIDRELDRRLRETAVDRDDVVIESRLAGWLAAEHADMKFWLDAPLEVRAARVAARENKPVSAAREETRRRETSEAKRYRELYGIDITDLSIYDLAVNTGRWAEETVPSLLVNAVEAYDPAVDEGSTPVEGVRYDF